MGGKELFFLIVGFGLFIFDLITDIIVAVQYLRQGHTGWFIWTLCFIIVPFFLVNIVALCQIVSGDDDDDIWIPICICCCPIVSVFTIFPRFIQQFVRWKRTDWDNEADIDEYNKSTYQLAWINYLETITESAPQLCLQVYIMFRQWYFPWYTVVSTVISLFSLAWSITNLEKVTKTKKGRDFTLRSGVLFFLHQLLSILSRLFAIVIFAYVFTSYVFIALLIRQELVVFSFFLGGVVCCNERVGNGFCIWLIFSFSFLFHPSKTILKKFQIYSRWFYYTLYGILFAENLIITFAAVFAKKTDVEHLNVAGPIAVSIVTVSAIVGAFLTVVHYYKYH